ncbi:MAG TPA: hypothetical protein VGI39_46045 [Polyangiaceae bacterium]
MMRFTAFLPPLAFLAVVGCVPPAAYTVEGAADYTSTPRTVDSSGALPLKILYCSAIPDSAHSTRRWFAQVGDECLLDARFAKHTVCTLPTGATPTKIQVEHAVMAPTIIALPKGAWIGPPFNLMAAGRTETGGYVSYRFTGTTMTPADVETCEQLARLLPAPPPPPPPKEQEVPEAVWSSWNRGQLCSVQGCAQSWP